MTKETLYVPTNIRCPQLFKECAEKNVTVEKYNITRVYTFIGSESDIRFIRTKHILKPYF